MQVIVLDADRNTHLDFQYSKAAKAQDISLRWVIQVGARKLKIWAWCPLMNTCLAKAKDIMERQPESCSWSRKLKNMYGALPKSAVQVRVRVNTWEGVALVSRVLRMGLVAWWLFWVAPPFWRNQDSAHIRVFAALFSLLFSLHISLFFSFFSFSRASSNKRAHLSLSLSLNFSLSLSLSLFFLSLSFLDSIPLSLYIYIYIYISLSLSLSLSLFL